MKINFGFFLFLLIINSAVYCDAETVKPLGIAKERIVEIEVPCRAFDDSTRIHKIKVLDIVANSVKNIFAELYRNNFPIYYVSGYENRNITDPNINWVSLHAYGVAIDVNEYNNPYLKIPQGLVSIDPKRCEDETALQDYLKGKGVVNESELTATIATLMQKTGSVDWFLNREIKRKGMLASKEADIFAKHGVTIWGGQWDEPMDFMHFQVPRKMAEHLVNIAPEEGRQVWTNHLSKIECQQRLKTRLSYLNEQKKRSDYAR